MLSERGTVLHWWSLVFGIVRALDVVVYLLY
jgi:hypothetical protein